LFAKIRRWRYRASGVGSGIAVPTKAEARARVLLDFDAPNRVAKVAFTGETTTGRLIMQYA
jgi:hypothetical protein